jgi:hypothetical protein
MAKVVWRLANELEMNRAQEADDENKTGIA